MQLQGNNRARGIYFKGQNSAISNNRVVGSALMGILMVPDFYFLESDFNNNVSHPYVHFKIRYL